MLNCVFPEIIKFYLKYFFVSSRIGQIFEIINLKKLFHFENFIYTFPIFEKSLNQL